MTDGAFVGLVLGLGLLAIWWSAWEEDGEAAPGTRGRRILARVEEDLIRVGLGSVPVVAVPVVSAGLGLLTAAAIWAISQATVPSLSLGAVTTGLPPVVLRTLASRRTVALRDVWPEAVDHVGSAIRAGMSLPEALGQLGERGPEELRPMFEDFARDYRASGDFSSALDRLKIRLADPVGDRVVEALRITRDVGGTDLGVLLRTLSAFLREDARTRAEIEARQSWTVNAARLALVAPWIVLALMSTRPQAAEAYDTSAGLAMILIGAVVSIGAYAVMRRIGRLPDDERVLR